MFKVLPHTLSSLISPNDSRRSKHSRGDYDLAGDSWSKSRSWKVWPKPMLLRVSLSRVSWSPASQRGLMSTLKRSPDQAAWNQYTMFARVWSIGSKQCVPLHWLEPSVDKTYGPTLSSAVGSYCLGKVALRSWLKMKCLTEDPCQRLMASEIGVWQAAETGAEPALRRTPILMISL